MSENRPPNCFVESTYYEPTYNEMRQYRDRLGLTQTKLAKLLKVSPSTIISIEAGRLSLSNRLRLKMESAIDPNNRAKLIDRLVAEYRSKLENELA